MNHGHSTSYLNFVGKENEDDGPPTMVRSTGEPIPNYRALLTVGPRGCPIMQDHFFMEDFQHVARGRVPERLFHARGTAAHGYFEVTNDITKYCAAKLFSKVGKRTPVFSRFSPAVGHLGSAETFPSLRGMGTKFYTEDGNWDLTCNNAQVFVADDPLLIAGIHNSSFDGPQAAIMQQGRLWDFLSALPETLFFQLWFLSDNSLPFSYRFMETFSVNTYKMINKHAETVFVRFQVSPNLGKRPMTRARGVQLAGSSPDYMTQDLVQSIERGDYPSWTLQIQVMREDVADDLDFNPFNVTKVWPVEQFPLIEVGRITLNRNMANHFDEAEQAVFNPGNFVPGIRAADRDKNLAGRMFIYQDTQIYRGGVNRNQIPINRPIVPVANYQREGRGVYVSQGSAPHYFPNSFGGPAESQRAAELDPTFKVCGNVMRYENSEEDHYTQPRNFWRSLDPDHQQRIVTNYGAALRVSVPVVQQRILDMLQHVDEDLPDRVRRAILPRKDTQDWSKM